MTVSAAEQEKTGLGNYFIANYPPFSFWKNTYLPDAESALNAERFELVLLERARFALERDLADRIPRQNLAESSHEAVELGGAEVRRRAAAEVDVVERPAAHARGPGE